jgi:hypothetical protein
VTALERWVNHPADALDQDRLRRWAAAWRDDAAGFAEDRGTAVDAPTARLLELLGAAAPERSWGVRPVAGLPVARALRALFGLPLPDATSWDVATAGALAEAPSPVGPVAPVGPLAPLPGSPVDERDDPDGLREMIEVDSEPLVGAHWRLGLLGHLLRAALIISRATIGQAHEAHVEGLPVDPGAALPVLDTPPRTLFRLALHGSDEVLRDLEENGDEGAQVVVARFHAQRRAAHELVRRWEETPERIFAALLATLDTAAFRVDPWIVGVADSRLRLLAGRRPFRLGAYGWVDRPRSHSSGEALAPGPTAAGVLHAPSSTHALTAALLRDAAVRHAGDERWQLAIDSARVRAAVRLAERVRLGVHPYEALGLEAERLIGDWEHVRLLRRHFPLRGVGDDGDERRACDGRRVLAAVLRQEEPVPPGLPVEAAELLQPLADALDTYADLLVADGVHALVSGRADLANQAMEAAAGLGAPPELRAIRTPRGATGVRVAAWAVLPLGAPLDPAAAPAVVADPAFARLLDDELGPPAQWTWHVEGAGQISLAELGLHGSELLDTSGAELDAVLRGDAAGSVTSTGGGERLEAAGRLADLLGGGEDAPPLAGAVTGAGGLDTRLAELVAQASALLERLEALDPADAAAVAGGLADLRRWRIEAPTAADGAAAPVVAGARELRGRIAAAGAPGTDVDALRATLRALVGRRRLPVLPLAAAPVLPGLVPSPSDGGGRPAVDRTWLEIVAAVRPRLAALEAHQLGTLGAPWPAAVAGGGATGDPWAVGDQVTVVYGPGLRVTTGPVGVAALDAWVDSVPAREHATSAAFGFNGPKARPPQALLVAVPPDLRNRMTPDELLQAVLETRRLVRARAARPETAERVATPAPFLPADARIRLFREWHQ